MFEDLGLLFFTVLILSLLFTPFSMRVAFHLGAVDQPVDRSVHLKPMPRLGGLGMVLSILVGMAMFLKFEPVIVAFMAGLLVIMMTGLADDVYQIRPRFKLFGQAAACLLFIELSGLSLTSFGDILGIGEITVSGPLAYAVTLFCMVGVINAFNLSDGLDGLAAGIVVIACFFLGFFALIAQAWSGLTIIVVLFAGVLGFLKFNSHPARLFMGDTGSLMLGFSIATVSIILGTCESEGVLPISIAIILALPIIDTMWVMTSRVVRGVSPGSPDNTHLHHRLLALGFPHSVVVTILYAWVVLFGVLALSVKEMPEHWQFGFAIALTALLYSLLTLCEHKKMNVASDISGIYEISGVHEISDTHNISGASVEGQEEKRILAHLLGRSMKLLPSVIFLGLFLPLLIADSVPASLGALTLGLAAFVAIAFPWRDHQQHLSVIYGLFYLCGFTILYAWNISTYHVFNLDIYIFLFGGLLLLWSFLKVKFKRNSEVFLTSSFELLLIFISWFVPYVVLPAIEVPESVLGAAKLACLGAIPLLIAMKLVIRRQPHRNRSMAVGLILILGFIAVRAM
ncbi:MAG: undecaprenyl/decaprenyl-phosphate alpha-N-acetylglucosaminyl 1-phosphate transferase [Mariprofundaceae bacterium]|nr:undecaprenyl/decaprenyl-phosphate alpha-N-acetylglucosaminyl 1-phosphate transferase [Mariprofundaceae bacterium]